MKSYIATGTVFTNPSILLEMLKLRSKGWKLSELAERYGADHSSIIYQCNKYDVRPYRKIGRIKINIQVIKRRQGAYTSYHERMKKQVDIKPTGKYDYLIFEKVGTGKSYEEYLQQENKRKKDLHDTCHTH